MEHQMLIILVGESGAGKSTFAKAMNCPDNWYISSKPMTEMLRQRGIEVTHDSIHAIAKEMYAKDPYWQIPYILSELKKKKFLILDGPRQLSEIRRLLELCPDTLVIRITANPLNRYNRLRHRDKIGSKEFQRIEEDEARETGLKKVLELADISVENNDSLTKLKETARKFGLLLLGFRNT